MSKSMDTYKVLVWDEFDESHNPTRIITFDAETGVTCPSIARRVKALLGWSGKSCRRTVTEDALYLAPYASCLSAEVFYVG